MVTVKLRSIETPGEAILRVLHDVVVSTSKFGGNRRFFGVGTANFVGCRGGTILLGVEVVISHNKNAGHCGEKTFHRIFW